MTPNNYSTELMVTKRSLLQSGFGIFKQNNMFSQRKKYFNKSVGGCEHSKSKKLLLSPDICFGEAVAAF